jgi:hypothetical protein
MFARSKEGGHIVKIPLMHAPSDVVSAKRTATFILQSDGLRLHLILTALLCLALGGGGLYLVESVFAIVPWAKLYHVSPHDFHLLNALYTLTDVAFTALVIFPLVFGAARIFFAAAHGEKLPLSAMFSAFDSARSYRRAVAAITVLALPRLLILLTLGAVCRSALEAPTLPGALFWWIIALALLVGASIALGFDDAFLSLMLGNHDFNIFQAWCASLRLTAPRLARIWRFKLSYMLWVIASVLSLGVLMFAHALPHYALAHIAWTDEYDRMDNNIAPRGKSI